MGLEVWLWNLVQVLMGLLVSFVGLGLYRSPRLDWEEFRLTLAAIVNEMGRLWRDPIAIVGGIVFFAGVIMIYHSFKDIIFRKKKTFSDVWEKGET